MITLHPVQSSNLAAVGYDPESEVLHVKFAHGALWEYTQITPLMHASLVNAPSVGGYYKQFVKGRFPARLIKSAAPTTTDATLESDLRTSVVNGLQSSIDKLAADPDYKGKHSLSREGVGALVGSPVTDAEWAELATINGGPLQEFLDWCLAAQQRRRSGDWLAQHMLHHGALREVVTKPRPEELQHLDLGARVVCPMCLRPEAAQMDVGTGMPVTQCFRRIAALGPFVMVALSANLACEKASQNLPGSMSCDACKGITPAGCRICGGLGTVPTRPMDF